MTSQLAYPISRAALLSLIDCLPCQPYAQDKPSIHHFYPTL
jgi:hypothetical protein